VEDSKARNSLLSVPLLRASLKSLLPTQGRENPSTMKESVSLAQSKNKEVQMLMEEQ